MPCGRQRSGRLEAAKTALPGLSMLADSAGVGERRVRHAAKRRGGPV
jgi:hypothetical protein